MTQFLYHRRFLYARKPARGWRVGVAAAAARRGRTRGPVIANNNTAGSATAINDYDEYGIPGVSNEGRWKPAPDPDPGYTGQIFLPELGLYHYKARLYSPTLGRFLQTDPVGYDDQINLYAYVGNDPVNAVDPSGMETCPDTPDPEEICVPGRKEEHKPDSNAPPIPKPDLATVNVPGADERGALQNSIVCDRTLPDGSSVRENVAEMNEVRDRVLRTPDPRGAAPLAVFGYWLVKVAPGGEWAGRLGEPGGNWNYGATGRAAGIPLGVLLRGAGAAEKLESITGRTGSDRAGQGSPFGSPPYGDNPEGQEQIRRGYSAQCN